LIDYQPPLHCKQPRCCPSPVQMSIRLATSTGTRVQLPRT
jgi:hypothetical protein